MYLYDCEYVCVIPILIQNLAYRFIVIFSLYAQHVLKYSKHNVNSSTFKGMFADFFLILMLVLIHLLPMPPMLLI